MDISGGILSQSAAVGPMRGYKAFSVIENRMQNFAQGKTLLRSKDQEMECRWVSSHEQEPGLLALAPTGFLCGSQLSQIPKNVFSFPAGP